MITFRELYLLFDEKQSSLMVKQVLLEVVGTFFSSETMSESERCNNRFSFFKLTNWYVE